MMKFLLCFVTFLALILYCLASSYLEGPFTGWSREELGQFGDSWGVITSAFSAFAFIGVVFTVHSQNESLKKLKSDSAKQDEFLNTQKFENNLFQMLNLLQSLIKDMDVRVSRGEQKNIIIHTGRDVFSYFYKGPFSNECSSCSVAEFAVFSDTPRYIQQLGRAFDTFYDSKQQDLGHYFRFLYNIFKYIDDSNISMTDKIKYSGIVRAQISDYELLLLMYNCLSEHGKPFIKYIQKYKLLDNIPFNKMIHKKHCLFLPIECFGAQSEIIEKLRPSNPA